MGELSDFFKNKKNLANILILGILILAIPLGINLVKTQQIIKSRAIADPVVFVANNNVFQKDGQWATRIATVSMQLTSPLGPAGALPGPTAPSFPPAPGGDCPNPPKVFKTFTGDLSKVFIQWDSDPNWGDIPNSSESYSPRINVYDDKGNPQNTPLYNGSLFGGQVCEGATNYMCINAISPTQTKQLELTGPQFQNIQSKVGWTYNFWVHSNKSTCQGNPVGSTNFTVLSAPGNVKGTCNADKTHLDITWDKTPGAVGYTVRVNRMDNPGWAPREGLDACVYGDCINDATDNKLTIPVTSGFSYNIIIQPKGNGEDYPYISASGTSEVTCNWTSLKLPDAGGQLLAAAATKIAQGLASTVYATDSGQPADNYCIAAGYHVCGTVGAPAGSCTKDGKTCTKYETYKCNFGGQNYCDTSNCSEPCSGGGNPPNPNPNPNPNPPGSCNVWQEKARVKLIAAGGNYQNASCQQITDAVCNNCGVFVSPDEIRTNLCGPNSCVNQSGGSCDTTPLTVSPNPANVGDTIRFNYILNQAADVGGDTWTGGVSGCDNNPLEGLNYHCTAQSAASSATWTHYWNNKSCSLTGSYTINGPVAPTPSPTPAAVTVKYRIAENSADFTETGPNGWQYYTSDPVIKDYAFKDTTPGQKSIFVQFKDSTGKTTSPADCPKCQVQIKLLGPDPTISSCGLNISGDNTSIDIIGENFGAIQGTAVSGTVSLTVQSWAATEVKLTWQNAPIKQSLPVLLTNSDGQTVTAQCSSISPLSLGAKIFCRAPADHQIDNVAMELAGAFPGGTLIKQKVSIDKNGNVLGLDKNFLQEGKQYNISLKAPRGLRKTTTFTATSGTVQLNNFVLPVGDIFPADGGDGKINSLDKSELNRQWNISLDTTRTGDFNLDKRVNAIDWACMRYDFNATDDPEPIAGGV